MGAEEIKGPSDITNLSRFRIPLREYTSVKSLVSEILTVLDVDVSEKRASEVERCIARYMASLEQDAIETAASYKLLDRIASLKK